MVPDYLTVFMEKYFVMNGQRMVYLFKDNKAFH